MLRGCGGQWRELAKGQEHNVFVGCFSTASLVCGGNMSGAYEHTHPIATTRSRIHAPRPRATAISIHTPPDPTA
eukprot:1726166-Prymnesium_polylepis.1